ncbi:DNA ligase [Paenibacillus sp. IHBB 3054]|uniref:DNA ligase n=1 Tax=Paenibacillus sp. IHBB 3054 TaxID=3425689 RepID=UPI003F67CDE4
MNIGSLIRGLLGDSKPGEAKSLELKEGQVVRGVVLSVSESGKEAVVQIQGTPVRAELETPLQPGQTLNLQVPPPGEGGLPVLKPVSLGESALASAQSMGEALESLGLSDSKAGREIIQAMQSGGLPLTKETAAKLDAVMNAKPQGVPTSEWLEAAVISVKRGLPVTAESVKGLQQAVFGPKLHELLTKLETELTLWAQQESEGEGGKAIGGSEKLTAPSGSAAPSSTGNTGTGLAVAGGELDVDPADAKAALAASAMPDEAADGAKPAVQSTAAQAGAGKGEQAAAAIAANTPEAEGTNPEAAAKNVAGTAAAVPADNESADAGVLPKAANAASGSSAEGTDAQNPAARLKESGADPAAVRIGTGSAGSGAEPAANAAKPGTAAQPERAQTATGNAGGPAAQQSGTALLTKLQGVLSELRGTLPQLAASPPANVAGGSPAPTPAAPPAPAAALTSAAAPTPASTPAPAPLAAPTAAVPAPAAAPPQGNAAPLTQAGQTQAPAAAAPRGESPAAASAPQPGPAATQDTESWVGRVLKLLGAEHEQQAVRGSFAAGAEARPVPAAAGTREAALPLAALQGGAAAAEDAADTLKGVLLQVMSSDAPPAVKEAAGQLVQQLTGQQLLLNTDRTAPFAQVTLFLPLRGEDGQETASVHIQSRRGRKGELDAANCRLWFDLDMKQLGQTLVDVQVVDRIVSLKVHNNDPWVLELLEDRREDVQSAVESIGYQLLSLRTEPLPEPSSLAASGMKTVSKLADYVPDSYKGVDYRI